MVYPYFRYAGVFARRRVFLVLLPDYGRFRWVIRSSRPNRRWSRRFGFFELLSLFADMEYSDWRGDTLLWLVYFDHHGMTCFVHALAKKLTNVGCVGCITTTNDIGSCGTGRRCSLRRHPFAKGVTVAKVYLINLRRRPDRLAEFRRLQDKNGWELPEPEVFEAVDGQKVQPPSYFTEGNGAHGCLRSHVNVLETSLMSGVENVLVLEDDLTWEADCWPRLASFLENVSSDYQCCMLGGQHMKRCRNLGNGVYHCGNTHRTHGYLLRGTAINSLLQVWYGCSAHCDWVMGSWMKDHPTYCPRPFIFGQAAGKSDINGKFNQGQYW